MVWLPSANSVVVPPQAVADPELVARSVHQSSGFKKAKEGEDKVSFRAFEPPREPNGGNKRLRKISVDRCQYLTETRTVTLAWARALARGGKFYGWAIIAARDARGCGSQVLSSPPVDGSNPAHADIVLPVGDIDDDQGRNRRLAELAAASWWLDAPA